MIHVPQGLRAIRPRSWAIGGIAALLLAYTVVRAATVSFTWDEGFTFVHHVSKGKFFQDTFDLDGANHHMLNVWAMWACMKVFGTGEFALRLPNLMAHVLYLYGSARIALKSSSAWLAIAAFVLMNAHPYLLDFFSLARGYGLVNGFIMMSLWCTWRYCCEGGTLKRVAWAMGWAVLAALSNAIALNYLLGLGGAFAIFGLWESRRTGIRATLPALLVVIGAVGIALAMVVPTMLRLSAGGSLHMGCERVWDGSVSTFADRYLYHQDYVLEPLVIAAWALGALGAWCCFAVAVVFRDRSLDRSTVWVFAWVVLLSILLGMCVQHLWLNVPWPRSRTALFLLPLVLFIVVVPVIRSSPRRWSVVIPSLLCVPLLVHAARCCNITYPIEWKGSGELRHMVDLLERDHLPLSAQRPIVTLSSADESQGPLPYYIATRGIRWLSSTPRKAPDPFKPSDYYIVEYDGFDQVDQAHWSLLYRSDVCNTSLYRDERFRNGEPVIVHHDLRDMEAPNLPGAVAEDHVSGRQCLRLDASLLRPEDLAWVVPQDWDGADVLATGTMMLKQSNDSTWMTLWISVEREGRMVEHRDLAASSQIVEFGHWTRVGVELRTTIGLRAGDVVSFGAAPYTLDASFFVDDMEFWVLREGSAP